jgi:hypothetical protein
MTARGVADEGNVADGDAPQLAAEGDGASRRTAALSQCEVVGESRKVA